MKKLQNLFVQHLRIIYDGEEKISETLAAINKQTLSGKLQLICEVKSEEKKDTLTRLKKVFHLLQAAPEGGKDDIIRSFIGKTNPVPENQNDLSALARKMFGRTMNIYQLNAYETAVSCARELGLIQIAELLEDCLNEIKFDKQCLDFLKSERIGFADQQSLFHSRIIAA